MLYNDKYFIDCSLTYVSNWLGTKGEIVAALAMDYARNTHSTAQATQDVGEKDTESKNTGTKDVRIKNRGGKMVSSARNLTTKNSQLHKSSKKTQVDEINAHLDAEFVQECRKKLLEAKSSIINRHHNVRRSLNEASSAKGGDEADQTVRVLHEQQLLRDNERLQNQLLEIEKALLRIEKGVYGICEETEETIEPKRLMAEPWTCLSIEGAELRESLSKRFAK